MMIDGWPVKVILKGDSQQAGSLLPYAGTVLRQMNSARITNKVIKVGDATLRLRIDPNAKLMLAEIELVEVKHGIVGIVASKNFPEGQKIISTGRPNYNRDWVVMERPKGSSSSAAKEPFLKEFSGANDKFTSKYGMYDWVYKTKNTKKPSKWNFKGYVTWGSNEQFTGIWRGEWPSFTTPTKTLDLIPPDSINHKRVWLNRKMILDQDEGSVMCACMKHVTVNKVKKKYLLVLIHMYTGGPTYQTVPRLFAVDMTDGFDTSSKNYAKEWNAKAKELATIYTETFPGVTVHPKYYDCRFRFNRSGSRCSGVVPVHLPGMSSEKTTNIVVHFNIGDIAESASIELEIPNLKVTATLQDQEQKTYGSSPGKVTETILTWTASGVQSREVHVGFEGSYQRNFEFLESGSNSVTDTYESTLFIDYDGDEERRYTVKLDAYEHTGGGYLLHYNAMCTCTKSSERPGAFTSSGAFGFGSVTMVESWTGPGPRDGVISYFKTTDVIVGESSTSIPQVNKILCTYSIGQNVEIDRIESTFDYNTQATTSESVRFYWLAADPRYGFYAGYRITYNSATNQTLYELVVNGTVVNSLTIDEPAEPNAEGGSDYLATYQVAYVLYKYTIAWIDFPDKLLYYPPRPALFSEFTRGPSTPYVTRTTRLGHATFATDGESWGEDEPKTFCNLHLPAFTPSGINNAQQQWIAYFGSSPAFSSIDIEDEVASYIISSGEPRFCKMGLV